MPFIIPIDQAQKLYTQYKFVSALTPSEQKAAFHVRDKEGNDLCLKIISPDYNIDRLHREIIALQSLSHPNIVTLKEYTFSSKPGSQQHYLVEEFIEGSDLQDLIDKQHPWDVDRAAKFFSKLFDGLDALHEKNLVHRDIKPKNIRVRLDGTPVIVDFGVVRHLSLSDLTKTSEGAGIGTPLYFAPEQFQGTKHDIDHRTDLYAAGTIMFEVLTGHHPFHIHADNYGIFKEAVCTSTEYQKDNIFTTLPHQWQVLVIRLLEKPRAKRPNDAAQVASIIRKLGGSLQ